MSILPPSIQHYLTQQHVVGITAKYQQEIWAASCFYAFEPDTVSLILLTSRETYHGQLMLKDSHVVGTISDQITQVSEIQGIQFAGQAELLTTEYERPLALYIERHPIAKLHQTDVWRIRLDKIKFTDNTFRFAHKEMWQRE
ncbi:hypothetical protein [Glaesserella sp.]|uniref:hypothetical protein n=1 Tax=Glaesserella sp. TaxID=2094731 RepID=UPI0035A1A817